jgi:hypothetical protein
VLKKAAAKKPVAKKTAVKKVGAGDTATKAADEESGGEEACGKEGAGEESLMMDAAAPPAPSSISGSSRPAAIARNGSARTSLRHVDPGGFGDEVEAALAGTRPAAASDERNAGPHPAARPIHAQHLPRHATRLCRRRAGADAIATELVASGRDKNLDPWQRWFAYLPFEHAESLLEQERSVALYAALRREQQGGAFDSALRLRRAAPRHRRPLRPLPASQCHPRPRIDGRRKPSSSAQPGSSF